MSNKNAVAHAVRRALVMTGTLLGAAMREPVMTTSWGAVC